MTHPWYYDEDKAWNVSNLEHLWVFDKLILSKKMGYNCGPVGFDVSKPDYYIVRPCVNVLGLGIGAHITYIERETEHLPAGYFWCEIFKGRHLSVDYNYGKQFLCVEGLRDSYPDDLTKWDKWIKTDDKMEIPHQIKSILEKYEYSNCEFIDGNLIEVHFRRNPDFYWGNSEYIPVYEKIEKVPDGYKYIDDKGEHIRLGALIK